ncbi:hypothetical protein ACTD5D_34990 [Nocardia takedensis]|uniref:hypothetical protein n=1 Tax=Nocardia takedensis TaxID=259390 RepID=UPI000304A0C6|nr:hypothetical protein [Nocardia takedensis]
MPNPNTYALYAWGNWIQECEIDRRPTWLDPAVLRGDRVLEDPDLTIYDGEPLRVDASISLYLVDGDFVLGRDFTPTDAPWRAYYLRLESDGTFDAALRLATILEEQADLYRDPDPATNPLPIGEIHTTWEDPHGQWDLALLRL